jgi:hypothetical protein
MYQHGIVIVCDKEQALIQNTTPTSNACHPDLCQFNVMSKGRTVSTLHVQRQFL